ncbi:hypothetical protein A4R35_15375 [Thermogemmatispora tikiterensis]|uniref:Uncharacterized protein n=1 Tax=Thermogemmatispora tikiterensis TaxID=1825093 RepID=A0A328VHL6_9CHLR|nr:hypothetical protein A4R35_15375 [Thermogemmatispora tikiterensis]
MPLLVCIQRAAEQATCSTRSLPSFGELSPLANLHCTLCFPATSARHLECNLPRFFTRQDDKTGTAAGSGAQGSLLVACCLARAC